MQCQQGKRSIVRLATCFGLGSQQSTVFAWAVSTAWLQEEIYSSSYAAAAYLEHIKFPADKKVYVVGEVCAIPVVFIPLGPRWLITPICAWLSLCFTYACCRRLPGEMRASRNAVGALEWLFVLGTLPRQLLNCASKPDLPARSQFAHNGGPVLCRWASRRSWI